MDEELKIPYDPEWWEKYRQEISDPSLAEGIFPEQDEEQRKQKKQQDKKGKK